MKQEWKEFQKKEQLPNIDKKELSKRFQGKSPSLTTTLSNISDNIFHNMFLKSKSNMLLGKEKSKNTNTSQSKGIYFFI